MENVLLAELQNDPCQFRHFKHNARPLIELWQCNEPNLLQMLPIELVQKLAVRVCYYKNGNIKSKTNYVNGRRCGERIIYYKDTNQIKSKSNYKDNWLHGEQIVYYKETNQIKSKFNYFYGRMNWVDPDSGLSYILTDSSDEHSDTDEHSDMDELGDEDEYH